MSIKLTWTKKDSDAVLNNYEIYRAVDKATLFQAGNLIATLADKNQVQYDDATTQFDKPYWYGIRSKTIYGDIDSTPVMMVECTNPGTGSATPVWGDYADGFIESLYQDQNFANAANKIIAAQILKSWPESAIEYSQVPVHTFANGLGASCVNKFWKNGKVIFAPNAPTIAVRNMTVKQGYDTVVTPLVTAKPQVEIDGVMYEFNIMTRAEAMKYIACGSYRHADHALNNWMDRVVPKTFSYSTNGGNHTIRLTHSDLVANNPGFGVLPTSLIEEYTPTASYGVTWGALIPWYFTPVLA